VHREYKFVNGYRIVALHQHMAAPLAHADYEKLDLEIAWGSHTLIGEPCGRSNQSDDVLHVLLPFGNGLTD
jgi:hypothetical protein